MPIIKSAMKRVKQTARDRQRNRSTESLIRSATGKLLAAVDAADKAQTQAAFRSLCSVLDKAAKHGTIKPNNASRRKGRAAAKVAAVEKQASSAATAPAV